MKLRRKLVLLRVRACLRYRWKTIDEHYGVRSSFAYVAMVAPFELKDAAEVDAGYCLDSLVPEAKFSDCKCYPRCTHARYCGGKDRCLYPKVKKFKDGGIVGELEPVSVFKRLFADW
jgi:hypothetical protein